MDYFHYREKDFFCEEVSIQAVAKKVGTPFYLYSASQIEESFCRFDRAFSAYPHLICAALKANSNLSIINLLARLGAGADIVSGGELAIALQAGIPAGKIVYSGVGKTEEEITRSIKAGILIFNVESAEELETLAKISRRMKQRVRIALRINPDINALTHRYITTGRAENKFGIHYNQALKLYRQAKNIDSLQIVGVQAHIGSQITTVSPFVAALKKLLKLTHDLRKLGIEIKYLDLGGGLGIRYQEETPPTPRGLAGRFLPLLCRTKLTLIFEPGRYLVGNSGCLVTKVIYNKKNTRKNFLIVDAGMNDLIRPAFYDAYHQVYPVEKKSRKTVLVDLVGPICETGDYLAQARHLPPVPAGELLAVMSAGAYGFSMSSNYNSRPRAAEVLVKGDQWQVIRQRETIQDLLKGQKIIGHEF
ncbi:MAG: diaminopimelate decarboxylase [Elusimicrobiota bacterium]